MYIYILCIVYIIYYIMYIYILCIVYIIYKWMNHFLYSSLCYSLILFKHYKIFNLSWYLFQQEQGSAPVWGSCMSPLHAPGWSLHCTRWANCRSRGRRDLYRPRAVLLQGRKYCCEKKACRCKYQPFQSLSFYQNCTVKICNCPFQECTNGGFH